MISYFKRNILDVPGPFIIAHGCNMQGVMGSGCALAIKNKYFECFTTYRTELNMLHGPHLGEVIWYDVGNGSYIANCLTQENTGTHKRQANYEAVYTSMEDVMKVARSQGFTVIHTVPIACGLAGCSWSIVSAMLNELSTKYNIDVEVSIFDQPSYDEFSKFTYQ